MACAPPKVLISYSHDSPEHEQRVLELANRLRKDGVNARLDQYVAGTPPEGWPRWMLNQLDWAEFVLVVCTETYYRRFRGHEEPGKGNLITLEMYDAKSTTTKFAPVLFGGQNARFIPEPLRVHTRYFLDSEENYIRLHGFLTGQSGVVSRELGPLQKWVRKQGKLLKKLLKRLTFNESDRSCGDLHGVPDLPPHYLPRDEVLSGLKRKLLSGDASVVITGQGQALGVHGSV